jgi:hypothetical protein
VKHLFTEPFQICSSGLPSYLSNTKEFSGASFGRYAGVEPWHEFCTNIIEIRCRAWLYIVILCSSWPSKGRRQDLTQASPSWMTSSQ